MKVVGCERSLTYDVSRKEGFVNLCLLGHPLGKDCIKARGHGCYADRAAGH